ncbi:hypothetical protein CA603_25030 [Paraburkholderia hospita]|nr:hypothetical protein CA603_25030 [Paraburkholderia hospita]
MKRIGFLSFGHWTHSRHSLTRSASDVLLQSIDMAVAAEELGADGRYFTSDRAESTGRGVLRPRYRIHFDPRCPRAWPTVGRNSYCPKRHENARPSAM